MKATIYVSWRLSIWHKAVFFLGDKPSGKIGGAFQVAQWQRILLANAGDAGSVPGRKREDTWRRKWQSTAVFVHLSVHPPPPCYAPSTTHPGVHIWIQVELQRQRGKRERTKTFPLLTSCQAEPWLDTRTGVPGGGNGDPLQYSCLGNPMDTGAWWATVYGVTKNRIQHMQS